MLRTGLGLLIAILSVAAARADEGMWTLHGLPLEKLKERYGFTPTPEWIEQMRLASVRFNDGGSGAFVSSQGLVLTNHHVARGQLQKLSSEQNDVMKNGFFAASMADEAKCPDLEINVLMSFDEVTPRVLGAVKADSPPGEQNEQRKAEMARIEKEETEKTGLRSDVVELYQGGEYWIYRYKKYLDVRLVMAPESAVASFGGDFDNFTFPRYDLDYAFFRVYENDKPVSSPKWLKFNPEGAKEGELVFVTGHPGSTDRLLTQAQLAYKRDFELPATLRKLKAIRGALLEFGKKDAESVRRAQDQVLRIDNSLKALTGAYEGLSDPKLMARKAGEEKVLRDGVAADPALTEKFGDAWEKIEAVQKELEKRHKELLFETMTSSKLGRYALTLVLYVAEVQKDNATRFKEFRESGLESLRHELFSAAPIYKDLEEHQLAFILQLAKDEVGAEDPYVKAALGARDPKEVAKEVISGTKLEDPEARKALADGGPAALAASTDPLVVWARGLEEPYRELRKWKEDNIESVESLVGNKIAQARFAIHGKALHPDATFTLRLSYGKVAGYGEDTTLVPYKTSFHGMFGRSADFDGKPPFELPAKMLAAKGELDLAAPVNFVSTNDIIGGNSGSPVINAKGEYVGLIFDGNIQSLIFKYLFDDEQARAVSVHPKGILETLTKTYKMDWVAKELVP